VSPIDLFKYAEENALFERVCDLHVLQEAFRAVKRNRGAPGVDGVTIEEYGRRLPEELGQLKKELESWTYQPHPVRRVEIPKPDGKGVRLLGVPTIRDRVVQASVKSIIEPILDPGFSDRSYGFRPGRSQSQAVNQAKQTVRDGKKWVVDIDLSKFFDRISHDRLIHRLGLRVPDKRILRLVGLTLRSGIMDKGTVLPSTEGSVQGSPLSPLLSNVVLDELDKELERRGLSFCRFADDCNIFAGSKAAADRIMISVTKFIENRLKLVVNQEKSHVALSQFVKFLGLTIVAGSIAISHVSMNRAHEKVKELTPRGTNECIEQSAKRINRWYMGWSGYYRMTDYPSQLAIVEAHIRRRLRARIVSQQKKRRHLFAKLVKRGVKRKVAARHVYSNKGRWALAASKAMHQAYPNKWFAQIGLKTRSDDKLWHWKPLCALVPWRRRS
jgi:group II intron reverse transcriptase/maturase